MTDFKEYIANQIVGKKLRFRCDCLMNIDFVGTIKDVTVNDNEFSYQVENSNGKIITIGSNHPEMQVSEISSI